MALAVFGKHALRQTLLKNHRDVLRCCKRHFQELDTVVEVKKKGYDCEVHKVTTSDGYNLTLHRVKSLDKTASGRRPVMIQHGLSCASTDWVVINGGLVYRLVDEGCDVWLGNTRGNIYSRSHVTLKPDDSKFWDFSWHEMGFYDLPSMIDYVLAKTQQTRLTFIGHSQGTSVFFVMASTRPEYNEKVSSMFALGPVAGLEHVGSVVMKQLAVRSKTIHRAAKAAGISHITLDTTDTLSKFLDMFYKRVKIADESMTYVLTSMMGYPCEEIHSQLFALWTNHVRNGLSLKQLAHFAQSISREYWFHYYDHEPDANMRLYGQPTPPPYPLGQITTPISLLYGPADWLAHPIDVQALYAALSTEKKLVEMPLPLYNHLDFCWSTKCLDSILDRILKTF